jgi:hypothetical protein
MVPVPSISVVRQRHSKRISKVKAKVRLSFLSLMIVVVRMHVLWSGTWRRERNRGTSMYMFMYNKNEMRSIPSHHFVGCVDSKQPVDA